MMMAQVRVVVTLEMRYEYESTTVYEAYVVQDRG